jgi:hypothetical protein
MGNPRHGRALPGRERDLQQRRAPLGVLEEELVEIAQPEQEKVIRIPPLELAVLLHHRGQTARLSH